jgi:hypothetical protein
MYNQIKKNKSFYYAMNVHLIKLAQGYDTVIITIII